MTIRKQFCYLNRSISADTTSFFLDDVAMVRKSTSSAAFPDKFFVFLAGVTDPVIVFTHDELNVFHSGDKYIDEYERVVGAEDIYNYMLTFMKLRSGFKADPKPAQK